MPRDDDLKVAHVGQPRLVQVVERVAVRAAVEDELEHGLRLEERLQAALVKGRLLELHYVDENSGAPVGRGKLREVQLAVAAQIRALEIDCHDAGRGETRAVRFALLDCADEHRSRSVAASRRHRRSGFVEGERRRGWLAHDGTRGVGECASLAKVARLLVHEVEANATSHIAGQHVVGLVGLGVGTSVKSHLRADLEGIAICDLRFVAEEALAGAALDESEAFVAAVVALLPDDDDSTLGHGRLALVMLAHDAPVFSEQTAADGRLYDTPGSVSVTSPRAGTVGAPITPILARA